MYSRWLEVINFDLGKKEGLFFEAKTKEMINCLVILYFCHKCKAPVFS